MEVNAPLSLSAVANVQQVQISDIEKHKIKSEYNFAEEVGPEVTYTLIAKNEGKIDFDNIELSFQYPTKYDIQQDDGNGGKDILYLYKVQKTTTETALKQISGSTETRIVVSEPMNRAYDNRPSIEIDEVKELVNPNGYKNRFRRFIWGKSEKISKKDECSKDKAGESTRMVSFIKCGKDKCIENQCETIYWKIPYLPANSFVELNLKFFISNKTILQEFEGVENIHIQTSAKLSVNNAYTRISSAPENQAYLSKDITITVDHQAIEIEDDGPSKWWFIIIGGLVAVLLYLILFCVAKKMGCFKTKRSESGHYQISDIDSANTSHRRSIKKDADDYQRRKSTASGGFETDSRAGTTLERRASQRGQNSQPNSTPNSQYNTLEKSANVGAGSASVNIN